MMMVNRIFKRKKKEEKKIMVERERTYPPSAGGRSLYIGREDKNPGGTWYEVLSDVESPPLVLESKDDAIPPLRDVSFNNEESDVGLPSDNVCEYPLFPCIELFISMRFFFPKNSMLVIRKQGEEGV